MTQIPQLPPHIDVQDDDLLVVRQSDNKDHKVPVAALSKGNVRYVQTIDDLRAVNGMQDGQAVEIVSTGRAGLFRWQAGDLSAECAADPMSGIYVAPTGQDGSAGAWVRTYSPIEGIRISWYGAVSDSGTTDNAVAIQAAYRAAAGARGVRHVIWDGRYGFGTKITVTGSVTTSGIPVDALGSSGQPVGTMIWTGGSDAMFSVSESRVRWNNLAVLNDGAATDWIECLPGSIYPEWDGISFLLPAVSNRFSRSVIYSDGHRLGYGKMRRINTGGSIAPKFIFVDGGSTPVSNRITTFSLEDSVIGASTGLEMTVLYFKNQGIETLNIRGNSFNNNSNDSNLVILDTTDSPISTVVFNFNFEGNEIDHIGTDPSRRKFKLENIKSINFKNNEASLGGQMEHIGSLVNSSITSYEGNTIRSLGAGPVWDADNDSIIVSGANKWGVSGTPRPLSNNMSALTKRVTQTDTSVRVIDLSVSSGSGKNIREIDVDVAGAFSIRAAVAEITGGTELTVVIRNVSGGAIAAPSFLPSQFALASSATAPSDGSAIAYGFYHNGNQFVEFWRSPNEFPNV